MNFLRKGKWKNPRIKTMYEMIKFILFILLESKQKWKRTGECDLRQSFCWAQEKNPKRWYRKKKKKARMIMHISWKKYFKLVKWFDESYFDGYSKWSREQHRKRIIEAPSKWEQQKKLEHMSVSCLLKHYFYL